MNKVQLGPEFINSSQHQRVLIPYTAVPSDAAGITEISTRCPLALVMMVECQFREPAYDSSLHRKIIQTLLESVFKGETTVSVHSDDGSLCCITVFQPSVGCLVGLFI